MQGENASNYLATLKSRTCQKDRSCAWLAKAYNQLHVIMFQLDVSTLFWTA